MSDKTTNNKGPDEVDLIDILRYLKSKLKFVARVSIYFTVVGLVFAFTSKVEYSSSCKLLPESTDTNPTNLKGLGGLAGLAGINLDVPNQNYLSPDLFPEIINSMPFQYELIHTEIRFEHLDSTLSSYNFFKHFDRLSNLEYIKKYTINLPEVLLKMFREDTDTSIYTNDLIRLTHEDLKILEKYRNRMSVSVDASTGIIYLESEMPDPIAAANNTQNLIKKLTAAVIDYRLDKAKKDLIFIEKSFNDAKKEYERNQEKLASFADNNRNITSSLFQIEYQRIQNEVNISYEIYKSLASQLEQARIKLKEETPVFTVLEPVKVPVKKSKPKRSLIVIISFLIGAFSSAIYFILEYLKKQYYGQSLEG